jgi:aldehyde dehydrogenase (NAD+)
MTVREILQTMAYGPAPESPEPALRWLEARGRTFRLFIGNRWVEPVQGESFETTNPATAKPLARFSRASAEDVDAAVQAATEALGPWRGTPGSVRARFLYALARQVQTHARLLAVLETLDTGTPIQKTREVEIPLVVRHFLHYAGSAHLTERVFPHYEPVGVCGQILPWHFPLLSLAQRIAPALAAGCTVVLKPSAFASLGAVAFCELVQEAGLPPGVVNVVTGDAQVDEALTDHPGIHQIAFTGPTEVGRTLRRRTAGTGKALALELAGTLCSVVFDSADLDSAVEGVVDAIGFGLHLLVQESIADRFLIQLRARMERLRTGDPLDQTVDLGPVVAPAHLEETRRLCEVAVREGARMWRPSWDVPQEGLFFPPTLFTDVAPSATIAQMESPGPVLVVMTFRTPQEAVELANTSRCGPRVSVWTEDIGTALDVARQIRAGTVWVNGTNLFEATGHERVREYLKPICRPSPPVPGPRGGVPDSRRTVEAAVEVARRAFPGWRDASGQTRARILHHAAENLEGCRAEFMERIAERTGDAEGARAEVEAAIPRLFAFAAWADKVEGRVYPVHPPRHLVVAVPEPVGVIGIVCPEEAPLLSLVTLTSAAIMAGNTVVVVPSESHTLVAADFVRVLEASDVPAGVVNVVTGAREPLGRALAQHDGVDAVWYFGPVEGIRFIELASAGNLKRTWVNWGEPWDPDEEEVLYRATRVKTIWIPYGT